MVHDHLFKPVAYMDTCFEHSICIVNGWIKILVIAERISACEANNWGKP